MLALFIQDLQHTQNSSHKTIENYGHRIERFVIYMDNCDVKDVCAMDILNFRRYLSEDLQLSKKTINFHIIALRSFFKFLVKNEVDCLSPEKLELAKIPQREVSFLQEDEIEDLLNAPLRYVEDPLKQARDVLILHILYGTGLRVSELISLKREQITF